MKLFRCLSCYFAVAIICSAPTALTAQHAAKPSHTKSVMLGVLERISSDVSTSSPKAAVRVLFAKRGSNWVPFPTATRSYGDLRLLPQSYPGQVTWTIAFDGRDLGRVVTRRPRAFDSYGDIGLEKVLGVGPVPSVGKPSMSFSSWTSDTPVMRPLVAVSKPYYRDPDQWKPHRPSQEAITKARSLFRNKFPSASNCRGADSALMPWRYSDADIRVKKAYASNNGWAILELSLTGWACDGMEASHGPFVGQWYVSDPTDHVRFLASGMWLVDAGDYDENGRSALLFSLEGYNIGGYRLYYRNFKKSVEYVFHYH